MHKKDQKGFTPVIILMAIITVIVGGYLLISKQPAIHMQKEASDTNRNQDEVTISGGIADNDTGCYHDGVCKVRVDDYWIITDLGGDPSPEMVIQRGPRGHIIYTNGTISANVGDNVIGKHVEVFARVIDGNTLSLYGKKDYYIRFKN